MSTITDSAAKQASPQLKLSGMWFAKSIGEDVPEGATLLARGDPENEYDDEAVAIYNEAGKRVAYIPADYQHRDISTSFKLTVSAVRLEKKGDLSSQVKSLTVSINSFPQGTLLQDNEGSYRRYWKSKEGDSGLKMKSYPSATSVNDVGIEPERLEKWKMGHESYADYKNHLNFYSSRGTLVHDALERYGEALMKKVIDGDYVIKRCGKDYFEAGADKYLAETARHNSRVDLGYEEEVLHTYPVKGSEDESRKAIVTASMSMYEGGLNFFDTHVSEVLEVEPFLVSEELQIAGAVDFIGRMKGDEESVWILDYKTSSMCYKHDYWRQLATYAQAYYEKTGIVAKCGIVKLTDKTKKGFQFIPVFQTEAEWREVLDKVKLARQLFNFLHDDTIFDSSKKSRGKII